MEVKDIKEKIENKIVAFATISTDNKPHVIAVEVNKVENNKIIITDNQMKKTPEYVKKNPNVCLVFWEGEKGWRIEGKAKYYNKGKWLDFVKLLKENEEYPAKGAIAVNIEKIEELS